MDVETLAIPRRKAEEEFQNLKEVFKLHHTFRTQDQVYQDLQKVYGHLMHGKKIIDIYDAFKKIGVNADGDPKLAIVRADAKICFAKKKADGGLEFSMEDLDNWRHYHPKKIGNILLPAKTYEWQPRDPSRSLDTWVNGSINIKGRSLKTIVPIIPPQILIAEVRYLLPNYCLLWEVEKWEPAPPKDPMLLKRLSPNLFGVLATWNLTPIERAVIRGRLQ